MSFSPWPSVPSGMTGGIGTDVFLRAFRNNVSKESETRFPERSVISIRR